MLGYHSAVTVCSDGSGVVSGSVSSSEIHFVVNFGDVGFDIDSTTGVWCWYAHDGVSDGCADH
jgi:hypothetical protein